MSEENIDEMLGGGYVLVNPIEGDSAEIDDASVHGTGSSIPIFDHSKESIDLTIEDTSDDGDGSSGLNYGAAIEEIDLTLEDTDEEEEFIGHYTSKLRSNSNRLKKRKARAKIFRGGKLCVAEGALTTSPAAAASVGICKRVDSGEKSSMSDSSSVISRFSDICSDEEKESPGSSIQPSKKSIPTRKVKTTIKMPPAKRQSKNSPKCVKKKEKVCSSKKLHTRGGKTHSTIINDLGIIALYQQLNFPIVREELKDVYYLMKFFGDKMLVDKKQYSPKQEKSPVESVIIVNGMKYELLYSKFVKRKGKSYNFEDSMSPKYYKSFYIGISDTNGSKLNLAEELLRIADFESLAYDEGPEKVISRLSLLVSPACKSPDSRSVPLVYQLKIDRFKVIDDYGHEGCGFIPKPLLTSILGNSKRAKESTAIQVRIFSPTGLGIGKGMLMIKDDIEKIEIPTSMIKVKKSTAKDPLHDDVVLIVSGIYPSVPAKVIGKIMDPHDKPSVSQLKDLKPPSEMFQNVMLAKGVSKDLLDRYTSNFKQDKHHGTKHASLVGVSDPTDSIPPGHVFLTGMSYPPERVFLTRSPCTEAGDGMVVKVCSKGDFLSDDYVFLSNLPFGTLIFPLGNPSLPSKINASDLDGDKFFAIWDEAIVNEAKCTDNEFLADDFAIHDDELVGTTFRHDGYNAQIIGKENCGEKYLVCVESPTQTTIVLSRMEIMSGRRFMSRVIRHNVKKEKTEFHIEWEDNSKEKLLSSDLKREYSTPPEVLLEYVRENKLAKTMNDCKWFEDHLGQATLIKITGHRGVGKYMEVQCEYDDNDHAWEPLNDHLTESKLLVGKYVKEKGLQNKDGWEDTASLWLSEIQEFQVVQREYEVGLLISRTCGLWKKSCNEFGANSAEALIWGRAYKHANELKKHGGHVKLPLMFYQQIIGKQRRNCKFLSLIEPVYGYIGPALSSECYDDHPDNDDSEHLRMGSVDDDPRHMHTHSSLNRQVGKWFTNDESYQGWGRSRSAYTIETDNQGWGRKSTCKDASTPALTDNHNKACVIQEKLTKRSGERNFNELPTSAAGGNRNSGGWDWSRDVSSTMMNDSMVWGRKTTTKYYSAELSIKNSIEADSSDGDKTESTAASNEHELFVITSGRESGWGCGKLNHISTTNQGGDHAWDRKAANKDSSPLVSANISHNETEKCGWGCSVPRTAFHSSELPPSAGGDDSASGWGNSFDEPPANNDDSQVWGRKIASKDSTVAVSMNNFIELDSSGWGHATSNVVTCTTARTDSGLGWGRSCGVSTNVQDDGLGWGRNVTCNDSSHVILTNNRSAASTSGWGSSTASQDTNFSCIETSKMPGTNKDDDQILFRETENNHSFTAISSLNQSEIAPTVASNSNEWPTSTEVNEPDHGLGRSPDTHSVNEDDDQGWGRKTSSTASPIVVSVNYHSKGDSGFVYLTPSNINELSTCSVEEDSSSCCKRSVVPTAVKDDKVWGTKIAKNDASTLISINNCSEADCSGSDKTL